MKWCSLRWIQLKSIITVLSYIGWPVLNNKSMKENLFGWNWFMLRTKAAYGRQWMKFMNEINEPLVSWLNEINWMSCCWRASPRQWMNEQTKKFNFIKFVWFVNGFTCRGKSSSIKFINNHQSSTTTNSTKSKKFDLIDWFGWLIWLIDWLNEFNWRRMVVLGLLSCCRRRLWAAGRQWLRRKEDKPSQTTQPNKQKEWNETLEWKQSLLCGIDEFMNQWSKERAAQWKELNGMVHQAAARQVLHFLQSIALCEGNWWMKWEVRLLSFFNLSFLFLLSLLIAAVGPAIN